MSLVNHIDFAKVTCRLGATFIISLCVSYLFYKSIWQVALIAIVLLLVFAISLPRLVAGYRSIILITEKCITVLTNHNQTTIPWTDVTKIDYQGSKFIPLTEAIKITSVNSHSIEINFNRKNYLNLWRTVLEIGKNFYDEEKVVDHKLLLRLGKPLSRV